MFLTVDTMESFLWTVPFRVLQGSEVTVPLSRVTAQLMGQTGV